MLLCVCGGRAYLSIHVQVSVLLPGFCVNGGFGNHLTSVTGCYVSPSWRDRGGDGEWQSKRLRKKPGNCTGFTWADRNDIKILSKVLFSFSLFYFLLSHLLSCTHAITLYGYVLVIFVSLWISYSFESGEPRGKGQAFFLPNTKGWAGLNIPLLQLTGSMSCFEESCWIMNIDITVPQYAQQMETHMYRHKGVPLSPTHVSPSHPHSRVSFVSTSSSSSSWKVRAHHHVRWSLFIPALPPASFSQSRLS